ncbi:histone deacetylase RPD3 [Geobacter sp. OR-1]|uniref:acetoin utilization protein AcuC n=1 Tax=Geobacter sp. OR-1 TaxID=1266765 RepID=UPI000542CB9E|nr:acetoin utilization protein AcuC [Geobacter sp. OR-1]GAM11067.1 histone deacetylase RPD3 [Geobacter sp. OR-1]
MPLKTALIYSSRFGNFFLGADHPFHVQRYQLAYELMHAYGLIDSTGKLYNQYPLVEEKELLGFHSSEYLEKLKEFSATSEPRADFRFGLGDVENPVFEGLFDWALLGTSGTVEAARLVLEDGYDIAFNLAGGWHHAHRSKASGFSYLNDSVIAINYLLERGKRIVYLDIDAHHGDGVQEAFFSDNRVLTISLHESGIYFFPGTGFESEIGTGNGKGYSVNVPLLAHSDDALYMKAFDEVAYPLMAAFDPDVIVTQLGADTFRTDPLTNLEITTHSYSYILRKLKALRIPWVAVGGGGYDNLNVARAWTIAWGIMNDVELSPQLPGSFVKLIDAQGYRNKMLLDAMHWAEEDVRTRALDALERSIGMIRKNVFPIIIDSHC